MVAFNKGIGEFAWNSHQKLINCKIIFSIVASKWLCRSSEVKMGHDFKKVILLDKSTKINKSIGGNKRIGGTFSLKLINV